MQASEAYCLEQANGADAGGVAGVLGFVEADAHMGLSTQVVYLIRLDFGEQSDQSRSVTQVAVVQKQLGVLVVWILVQVIDA